MSDATPFLLQAALRGSDAEAASAWKSWRSAVDIQHLSWPEMQILPMLNGPRLEKWLAEDAAAGILKGIVRRAWSEAQVRLGLAKEVVSCLKHAGCDSVTVAGALGSYLRGLQSTAIRPVLELRILIPRLHLAESASALEAEGWLARDEIPTGDWLDRTEYVLFNRNGNRLYLHWRLLTVPARMAAGCERRFLAEHCIVNALGTEFRILAPGLALMEALTDRKESVDALAWQVDAAAICRQPIDELLWADQAAPYWSQIFRRVLELRKVSVAIPVLQMPPLWMQLFSRIAEIYRHSAGSWARQLSAAMGKH